MTRADLLQIAKPILFNTEMVRVILEGRKTVTRRVMKPQPKMKLCYAFAGYGHGKWHYPDKDAWRYWGKEFERPTTLSADDEKMIWTPPCHTDDILYVRETWQECCRNTIHSPLTHDKYCFKASLDSPLFGCIEECGQICKWRPSIHMPKEAARIFLRVVDVRVERLQDIMKDLPGPNNQVVREGCKYGCDFIAEWENTIPKGKRPQYGWDANPWVWVVEFEMEEAEME